MANIWDLPKPIREKIYRLHLVQEQPVSRRDFTQLCGNGRRLCSCSECVVKMMPCLLQADRKLERETANIFFGENTFEVSEPRELDHWVRLVHKRHYNRIRKILLKFTRLVPRTSAAYNESSLRKLGAMRGLKSLTVELDEQKAIEAMLTRKGSTIQWHKSLGYGPQVQLHLLHLDGMHVLRAMKGLQHVEFTSLGQQPGVAQCDLLQAVKREMMQPLEVEEYKPEGSFPFLKLPPELRNIIYDLLLVNSGVTYPTLGTPTSISSSSRYKSSDQRAQVPEAHSALNLLRVNRQTHAEAHKLFYYSNNLVFSEPVKLQSFVLSLGNGRIECLRSVTLFCKAYGPDAGASVMDNTLCSLRFLPGLRKLSMLLPDIWQKYKDEVFHRRCVGSLPGVRMLLSFRGLLEISYRDLYCEYLAEEDLAVTPEDEQRLAALRHLSHGLKLAQKGVVVYKLCADGWEEDEDWPALEGSDCGVDKGCSCGKVEEGYWEGKDVGAE